MGFMENKQENNGQIGNETRSSAGMETMEWMAMDQGRLLKWKPWNGWQ